MSFQHVPSGRNVPHEVNVIVEIPLDAEPVKYEIDKRSGAIFVDRVLSTAMRYPCNYGYVPHSLCEDGDPIDALVVLPLRLVPGAVICCRPIGVLRMVDDKGGDEKLLCVPADDVTSIYRQVRSFRDLPPLVCEQIAHFFQHYKDLEPGKWARIDGWGDADEARAMIEAALARFAASTDKPAY